MTDIREWENLYQGDFTMTERTDLAWQLAKEYYDRCDAYDETVCTGRSKYSRDKVPATNEEYRLINRHAFKVLKEVRLKADCCGVTREALREAMNEYVRIKDRLR